MEAGPRKDTQLQLKESAQVRWKRENYPSLSLHPDPGLQLASVLFRLAWRPHPPLAVLRARKADALGIKGQYLPCFKEAQRQLEEEQVTYFAGWLEKKKSHKKSRTLK